MSAQTQTRKAPAERKTDEVSVETDRTASAKARENLEALDELLDEIDEVLESNAEEFVKSYIQKGGQ